MTNLQLPKEDCTAQEAIDYCRQVVEGRDEAIEKLNNIYEDEIKKSELRGFCLDRAVRLVESATPEQKARVIDIAKEFYDYVVIQKPAEVEILAKKPEGNA